MRNYPSGYFILVSSKPFPAVFHQLIKEYYPGLQSRDDRIIKGDKFKRQIILQTQIAMLRFNHNFKLPYTTDRSEKKYQADHRH